MSRRSAIINNQKGMAMIETIPLIVLFVMLISFALGFFGIVHTAVLHSIAARTYSFETLRNRTNYTFFRDNGSGATNPLYYGNKQWRFHGVSHETDMREEFVPSSRPIAWGRSLATLGQREDTHNEQIFELRARNERVEVSPVWIMVGYGICISARCGD